MSIDRDLIERALLESKTIITGWRDHILESCCLLDADDKPIRDNLVEIPEAKEDVERMEKCLESIEAAQKEIKSG